MLAQLPQLPFAAAGCVPSRRDRFIKFRRDIWTCEFNQPRFELCLFDGARPGHLQLRLAPRGGLLRTDNRGRVRARRRQQRKVSTVGATCRCAVEPRQVKVAFDHPKAAPPAGLRCGAAPRVIGSRSASLTANTACILSSLPAMTIAAARGSCSPRPPSVDRPAGRRVPSGLCDGVSEQQVEYLSRSSKSKISENSRSVSLRAKLARACHATRSMAR